MDWEFFNYNLPENQIATRPLWHRVSNERGQSKLLHALYSKDNLRIKDRRFSEITDILTSDDILVFNDTKVINARFKIEVSGVKDAEILLCNVRDSDQSFSKWIALARPMKTILKNKKILISESLEAEVIGKDETERFLSINVHKRNSSDSRNILEIINKEGLTPIPPYIREGNSDEADREEYQTVFAKKLGSVAAPTAALHFSKEILQILEEKGVDINYLTLHVGPASFLPVNDPLSHRPFPEMYSISKLLWQKIEQSKIEKKRIIAVGTTVIRSLEAFASLLLHERVFDCFIQTDLFIQPGYTFKVVDSCFTNFHQPKSTHLLLIAALVGKATFEKIYSHALKSDYRFLSYGDSSFLERIE